MEVYIVSMKLLSTRLKASMPPRRAARVNTAEKRTDRGAIVPRPRMIRRKSSMGTVMGLSSMTLYIRFTFCNWENGYTEPEEDLLPYIAGFFGIKTKDLISDEPLAC